MGREMSTLDLLTSATACYDILTTHIGTLRWPFRSNVMVWMCRTCTSTYASELQIPIWMRTNLAGDGQRPDGLQHNPYRYPFAAPLGPKPRQRLHILITTATRNTHAYSEYAPYLSILSEREHTYPSIPPLCCWTEDSTSAPMIVHTSAPSDNPLLSCHHTLFLPSPFGVLRVVCISAPHYHYSFVRSQRRFDAQHDLPRADTRKRH